jgi:membrane protease YdiL (CAAX protease family)
MGGDVTTDDTADAETAPAERGEVPRSRLLGWLVLVSVLATLAYAANVAEPGNPRDDLLYLWSTAVSGLITYGIILAVLLVLARGVDRSVLGLRPPARWGQAMLLVLGGFVTIAVIGRVLDIFLKAGDEQGLLPDGWDSSRAAPFVANAVVVAVVAPVVEELSFRGVGYAAMGSAWGAGAAVLGTSAAFGLAHGLVVALPVLTVFGLVLAVVRYRSRSLYPSIILHALFNGLALLVAVTAGGSV